MKTQKHFTQQPQLAKYWENGIFVFLSLCSGALNYAFYPMIARRLSTDDFGASQALLTLLSQSGALFAGLAVVAIYLVKIKTELANRLLFTLQKILSLLIILIALVILAFQEPIRSYMRIDSVAGVYIVLVDLLISLPFIIIFGYLIGKRQLLLAALFQLASVILKLIIGVVLTAKWGINGALISIAFSQLIAMTLLGAYSSKLAFSLDELRSMLSRIILRFDEVNAIRPYLPNILSLVVVSAFLTIFVSLDIVLARGIFDGHTSGLYSAASTLGTIIIFTILPMINILISHVTPGKPQSAWRLLLKIILMSITIGIGVMLIFIFMPSVLLDLYGSPYLEISTQLWRFGLYMTFVSLTVLLLQVLALHIPRRTVFFCILIFTLLIAVSRNNATVQSFITSLTVIYCIALFVLSVQYIFISLKESHGKD